MPCRWAFRLLLLLGLAVLAYSPVALGQGGTPEKITYKAPDGKIVTELVEIKESAAGIQLIVGGKAKAVVSPADVIRIDYSQVQGVNIADLNPALAAEGNREAAKAQIAFADLLKKAGPAAPERTKRYLMFREAFWGGELADQKTGDDFKAEAPKAADRLATVARSNKKSWEVWPTGRSAARIYTELGDFAKAAAILGEISAIPDLPRDLKYDSRLAELTASLRAGQGLSVETALDQLEKDKEFPATGPLRDRLIILKAVAKLPPPPAGGADSGMKLDAAIATKIEATIAQVKDPIARAVGSNFLGDAYLAYGMNRDAMWAYLWADVVYNQDTTEQVYAINRLVSVFDKLGDKDRSDQFRDKLPRVR